MQQIYQTKTKRYLTSHNCDNIRILAINQMLKNLISLDLLYQKVKLRS